MKSNRPDPAGVEDRSDHYGEKTTPSARPGRLPEHNSSHLSGQTDEITWTIDTAIRPPKQTSTSLEGSRGLDW
jgi:hypothetical protein